MFRFLDEDWTVLFPNRRDHRSYRGSNKENDLFYGGRSVVFAVPESSLEKPMRAIDIQVYVFKEICSYFELDPCENVGFALLRVDPLLNSIIKELRERKELGPYLCKLHENNPISRSLVGTYPLMNDDLENTNVTIKIYIRISYLGNCVITEFENHKGIRAAFHCRKDNIEGHPYQLRELTSENLKTGCWGSQSYLPAAIRNDLACYCAQDKIEKDILARLIAMAEALRAARMKQPESEVRRKKKKKKKPKEPDAHILANIDNLYEERMRLLIEALKERQARGGGFSSAGVQFDSGAASDRKGMYGVPYGSASCSAIGPCSYPLSSFVPCMDHLYSLACTNLCL